MRSVSSKLYILYAILTGALQGSVFNTSNANEISQACAQAIPGDTIIMMDGLWFDQKIIFRTNGTESDPIVLKAKTPGQVILSGTSTLRIAGDYLEVSGLYFRNGFSSDGAVIEFRDGSGKLANHSRLTNTAIVDYNPSNKSTDYKWVSIYGTYNRVDNCYFKGKNHSGTTLVVWFERVADPPPHFHRIDHNYFGARPDLGFNGGESIRIGTSTYSMYDSFTTVESNLFEHCDGEIEIISNKSCGNIYFNNTFFESRGTLTLRHGNRCTVAGNYFFGNNIYNTGGVRVIGEDHRVYNNYFQDLKGTGTRSAISIMNGVPDSPLNRYFQVKNADIINNTVVNCTQGIEFGSGSDSELSLPPLNTLIANNIIYATGSEKIISIKDEPVNTLYMSNFFYGSNLGITDTVPGIIRNDPDLIYYGDSLWRPIASSPIIGASDSSFDFIDIDMDGHERVSPFDIGSDQYSSDPVIFKHSKSNDVGPKWLNNQNLPLFVSLNIIGSGKILQDPSTTLFDYGDTLVINAVPDSGWTFEGWEGDWTGKTNPDTIIVNKDYQITARFSPPVTYTIFAWIVGNGEVKFNPPGPDYNPGTRVEVTAVPEAGWAFTGWSGDLTGDMNPDTLITDSTLAIMATFNPVAGVGQIYADIPLKAQLEPVYPNPTNSTVNIPIIVNHTGLVELMIYSINGELVDQMRPDVNVGRNIISWNTNDFSSGMYIVKAILHGSVHTSKILLIK